MPRNPSTVIDQAERDRPRGQDPQQLVPAQRVGQQQPHQAEPERCEQRDAREHDEGRIVDGVDPHDAGVVSYPQREERGYEDYPCASCAPRFKQAAYQPSPGLRCSLAWVITRDRNAGLPSR